MLEGGECTANAGVVGNFTVLVQGYIEIHTNDGLLASKIVTVDSHNVFVFLFMVV